MRIDDLTRLQTAAELLNFVITLEMSGGVAASVAGRGEGGGVAKSWDIWGGGGLQRVELFGTGWGGGCKELNYLRKTLETTLQASTAHGCRERVSGGMGKAPTPMTMAKFNLSDQKNCERSFVQHVFSKWSNRKWETTQEEGRSARLLREK